MITGQEKNAKINDLYTHFSPYIIFWQSAKMHGTFDTPLWKVGYLQINYKIAPSRPTSSSPTEVFIIHSSKTKSEPQLYVNVVSALTLPCHITRDWSFCFQYFKFIVHRLALTAGAMGRTQSLQQSLQPFPESNNNKRQKERRTSHVVAISRIDLFDSSIPECQLSHPVDAAADSRC